MLTCVPRKTILIALLAAVLLAAPAVAQRGGGSRGGSRGGGSRGGSFHGGGVRSGGGFRGGFVHPRGFGGVRVGIGVGFGRVYGGPVYWGAPYPYPYSYYPAYDYYPPQPQVVYVPQPPQVVYMQQPPQVVYAPEPRGPSEVYSTRPAVSEAPRPPVDPAPAKTVTLLVFKDHSIYSVNDYWIEGNQLRFTTNFGSHKSLPLDQLDVPFTRQLNDERNVRLNLHN